MSWGHVCSCATLFCVAVVEEMVYASHCDETTNNTLAKYGFRNGYTRPQSGEKRFYELLDTPEKSSFISHLRPQEINCGSEVSLVTFANRLVLALCLLQPTTQQQTE